MWYVCNVRVCSAIWLQYLYIFRYVLNTSVIHVIRYVKTDNNVIYPEITPFTRLVTSPERWNWTTLPLSSYRFEACTPDHRGSSGHFTNASQTYKYLTTARPVLVMVSQKKSKVTLYLSEKARVHKVQSHAGCPKAYLCRINTIKGKIVWSVRCRGTQTHCDWLSDDDKKVEPHRFITGRFMDWLDR